MVRASKVVVGFDGSPAGLRALWVAVEEARQRYAPLDVVYVPEEIGLHSAAAAATAALVDVDVDRARELVNDAFVELYGGQPGDLVIRVVVSRLPIRHALLGAVEEGDLLVVGRSRSGLLRRLISGSVGQYCAVHAPCPVLIVPPPEKPRRSYSMPRTGKIARRGG